ncbi:RNA 2',3'-cyclic phosphodiesterase [Peptococcaceae bacterium 1198_IL3148]
MTMTNQRRLFIAVNLPTDVKGQLHQLQRQLYVLGGGIKWVEPYNFHITIKFLGETDQQQLSVLEGALAQSVIGINPFGLHLNKLGTFPQRGTPRVVWVGLGGDINCLKTLQQQVEHRLAAVGFAPEKRKFSPHLTLGRVKTNVDGLLTAITTIKALDVNFAVNSVELMQSVLTGKGPVYSRLASYGLG